MYGYGNCEKKFMGEALCYVNLPSSCSDLEDSTTDPGEKISVEACLQTGK